MIPSPLRREMFGMGTIFSPVPSIQSGRICEGSAEQIADVNCVGGRFHETGITAFAGRKRSLLHSRAPVIQGSPQKFSHAARAGPPKADTASHHARSAPLL